MGVSNTDSSILLYQSILLAEHAIMRANAVALRIIPPEDAMSDATKSDRDKTASQASNSSNIAYIVPYRGLFLPSASRGLDPLVLAYAIARGLLWDRCGVGIFNQTIKCRDDGNKTTGVEELAKEMVQIAVNLFQSGLLIPLPYTAVPEDTLTPAAVTTPETCSIPGKSSLVEEHQLMSFLNVSELKYIISDFSKELGMAYGVEGDEAAKLLLAVAKQINDRFKSIVGYSRTENSDENYCVYFKTLHGEIGRFVQNARSLPITLTVSSVNVLPILLDPPTIIQKEYVVNLEKLRDTLIDFYLAKGLPRILAEKASDLIIRSVKESGINFLLPYQWESLGKYLSALKNQEKVLLILSSPTGTGKTIIFAILVIVQALLNKLKKDPSKILIIYPRKTLERQQLDRVLRLLVYINEHSREVFGNEFDEIRVLLRDGESKSRKDVEKTSIRGLKHPRTGEDLTHRIEIADVEEYGSKCVYESHPSYVFDVKEGCIVKGKGKKALELTDIVITNHSMLFKMAIHSFRKQYFRQLFSKVSLIVFDEAHIYYEPSYTHLIQFVSLMLPLHGARPSIIFSSATTGEEQLIHDEMLTNNIVGVIRRGLTSEENVKSSVEKLLVGLDFDTNSKVMIDYFSLMYNHITRGNSPYKGPLKITLWYVAVPYPGKRASTSLEEVIVSIAHLINGMRRRNPRLGGLTSIIYVDHKATLKDIVSHISSRILIEAVDHADRVLLSNYGRNLVQRLNVMRGSKFYIDQNRHQMGIEFIQKPLESRVNSYNTLLRVIWDLDEPYNRYFASFHALSTYLGENEANLLKTINDPLQITTSLTKVVGDEVLYDFIEEALSMMSYRAWIGEREMMNFLDSFKNTACNNNSKCYFIIHHGDFAQSRELLDQLLMSKDCSKPIFTIATSTLELGLDIPAVLTIIQYGAIASSSSLIQRVGRSGRDASTMFVSNGVLVLRNDGRDNFFIDDYYATRYVFNSSRIHLPSLLDDPVMLARLACTLEAYAGEGDGREFLKKISERWPDKNISLLKAKWIFEDWSNMKSHIKKMLQNGKKYFEGEENIEQDLITLVLKNIDACLSIESLISIKDRLTRLESAIIYADEALREKRDTIYAIYSTIYKAYIDILESYHLDSKLRDHPCFKNVLESTREILILLTKRILDKLINSRKIRDHKKLQELISHIIFPGTLTDIGNEHRLTYILYSGDDE